MPNLYIFFIFFTKYIIYIMVNNSEIINYYYYKLLDIWLYDELSGILNYFIYKNNMVYPIKNLLDYNSHNINSDTDYIAEKKIDYIETNFLNKNKFSLFVDEFLKNNSSDKLPQIEFKLFINQKLIDLIKNEISQTGGLIPLIFDPIWAPDGYQISDDKLLKLLNSKTVERLAYIGQAGPLNYVLSPTGFISHVTRKMHSVGCMILTLIVGGTIDEAIVALLHDIIHTAFSHTIDYLVGKPGESYHESHKEELLKPYESELFDILGPNWKDYLKESKWPLIKSKIFGTDIADYITRDSFEYGFLTNHQEAIKMAKSLSVDQNRQLICPNSEVSNWWKHIAENIDKKVYAAPWNSAMNFYLSRAIRDCIDQKTIKLEDLLYVTDHNIENKTMACVHHTNNGELLYEVTNKNWKFVNLDDNNPAYHFVTELNVRHRIINPPIKREAYNSIASQTEKKKLVWLYKT